ncbi:MAG: hypothetical protein ACRDLA_13740 [Thermoleophilaceae bacterium]
MTHTGHLRFSTEGDGDVIDLTEGVRSVVEAAATGGSSSAPGSIWCWSTSTIGPASAPWSGR